MAFHTEFSFGDYTVYYSMQTCVCETPSGVQMEQHLLPISLILVITEEYWGIKWLQGDFN